jgi:hypothetical protein
MTFEGHLRTTGLLLLLLAALHPFLPRALGWKEDLRRLTLVNRQIFLVHVGFIVLLLVLLGVLTFSFASELAAPSRLARAVLGGLAIFWGLRLATQLFVYDRSLWRGSSRNTAVHVVASLLWSYFTAVFAWGFWR